MTNILREETRDPAAWTAEDMQRDQSWVHPLTPEEIADLERAAEQVIARGLKWGSFSKADFDLPVAGSRLAEIDQQIRFGRGVVLIRGLRVENYSPDFVRTIYWGLGVHLGKIIHQNAEGDLIGPITDQGISAEDANRRKNTTTELLGPHTDLADVVVLLCIERAKEGGISGLASSIEVHNQIVRNHPEYLEPLYEGFYRDVRGNNPEGNATTTTDERIPVYEYYNGRVNCQYGRPLIFSGARKAGIELTDLQKAAVDYVGDLAVREDMRVDMLMEPGDVQIINNYTVLHSRSNYVDHDDGRKRYLLRMWINLPNHVQLSDAFARRAREGWNKYHEAQAEDTGAVN